MIRQLPDPGTLAAAFLLLLVVTFAPLPFGSVLPRERLTIEIAGFSALACLVVRRRDLAGGSAAARPALALAGVGVFGLLQSLPWPTSLASLLTPRAAASWAASKDLLGEAAGGWTPLTLSPPVSRSVALLWLAAAATLAAASAVAPERRLRRLLAVGFLAVTVFEIAYGADKWFGGSPEIWGRTHAGEFERLRGTFVNPDHFALFLVVALAAVFAWVWWSMRRALWTPLALERRLLHIALPWFVFIMLFVGLAFTGSRAGLVGGLIALAAQGLVLAWRKGRWQAGLLGLAALGLGLASLVFFGWQRGMSRWLATSAYEITWNKRFEVYRASLELVRESPWTGTGLGTFRQAFPWVQPAGLELSWYHAHSDLLELLVTTGLVGPAVAVWGLAALVPRLTHGLRHGRRSEDRAVALAAIGALAGALAHSSVDFGLTLPANAFVLATLVGLGCGVRTRSPEPHPGEQHQA